MDAKAMSMAIRSKRKKLKEEGVDKMVDTAALPQMNPQDVLNLKQKAQMEETMDIPKKSMAPDDPADPELDGTQKEGELKKRMRMVGKILSSLTM